MANKHQNELQLDIAALVKSSGLDEESCHLLLCGADEHWVVAIIKQHLQTDEQRLWLYEHDLYIQDLLNGRTTGDVDDEVRAIFANWNEKLGRQYFGSNW